MTMSIRSITWVTLAMLASSSGGVLAGPFFSTGDPDGKMGMASRPGSAGKIEIEAADDFVLAQQTSITSATFTGLLTDGATVADISHVVVEIYRVFPFDSTVPPSGNVPTRNNSPSDVAFDSRDSAAAGLSFTTQLLATPFTVSNSVVNGIHPIPNQNTLGEGPRSGSEVQFSVTFATPFNLPADHYFFVPQVALNGNADFLWLSAPRPIVPPGTPFSVDLQTWIRDENLNPDWLRVGTDIVGNTAFNASFSLTGDALTPSNVPLPPAIATGAALAIMLSGARRLLVLGSREA